MIKSRDILNYFGLGAIDANNALSGQNPEDYLNQNNVSSEEKLKLHRDFLKSIEAQENDRLTLIESKTSQMVSQTGIIFALLSLFITLVIDKIDSSPLKVVLLIILSLTFIFYLLTIYNAAKNFNIKNFVYVKSSANNVLKYKDKTIEEFITVEINDLLKGARKNVETNNLKADNLIYSYNCFKIANLLTAIIGVLLCVSLFFTQSKKDSVTIENPIKIENYTPNTNH